MLEQRPISPLGAALVASLILPAVLVGPAAACDWNGEPAGRWGWAEPLTGEPEKDTFGLICLPAGQGDRPAAASRPLKDQAYIGLYTGDEEKDTFSFIQVKE